METLKLAFDAPVVIMDTETGGLSPKPDIRWYSEEFTKDQKVEGIVSEAPSPILQISAVRLNQQTLEEEKYFDTLVGPNYDETVDQLLSRCTSQALEVNGIGKRKDELAQAPSLQQVMSKFLNWLPRRYLIAGQNIQFDLNFLNAAMESIGKTERFYGQPLELLAFSRLYFSLADTPIVANHKLETIASALNIDTESAHDALFDCRMTADVMRKIFKRFSLK